MMTDEEFEAILGEVRFLRKGLAEAVDQLVYQQGEIQALHWLLADKRVATPAEIDAACEASFESLQTSMDAPEVACTQVIPRVTPRRHGTRCRH